MFDWFKIFNSTEFLDTGLVSRTYSVELEGYGFYDILATKGVRLGVLFDGVFLTPELNATNPFVMDSRAVYLDENLDVWVGFEVIEA